MSISQHKTIITAILDAIRTNPYFPKANAMIDAMDIAPEG